MATRLRSFAKINLGLAIGPVRGDGFHELLTVYQAIGLHDVVTVEARRAARTRISLSSSSGRVPTDVRNTAWRMVQGALERLGLQAEVHIHIEKRLPVQGGMGAGSANAAAALLALERELGVEPGGPGWLSEAERLMIAAEVGSDVPLFLIGGTVLGEGRGEVVSALPDLRLGSPEGDAGAGVACVVAVPEIGVSTPAAFRAWDERLIASGSGQPSATTEAENLPGHGSLTAQPSSDTLLTLSLAYASAFGLATEFKAEKPGPSGTVGDPVLSRTLLLWQPGSRDGLAENSLLALVRTGVENDFEEVVFPHHSLLRSTKRLLMGCDSGAPAVYAAMSGSGSALFGLYRTGEAARMAQQRVEASHVKASLTETLSRERYWSEMFF